MQSPIDLLECLCHGTVHRAESNGRDTALRCRNARVVPIEEGVLILSTQDAPSDPWSHTTAEHSEHRKKGERSLTRRARFRCRPLFPYPNEYMAEMLYKIEK